MSVPLLRGTGTIVLAVATMTVPVACGGGAGAASSRKSAAGSSRTPVRDGSDTSPTIAAKPLPPPNHTECRAVVYIGDSTSEGQVSAQYIPRRRQRLPAQLARVGVRTTYSEISGARSIVEIYHGIPNAATVARQHISDGFRGCWILALGTNEVADVAAGSTAGLRTRIARMMSIIGNQPVMWVNVITLGSAPRYYGEAGMRRWNQDLLTACGRYPMMRVFDWAALARRRWFIPDGIHYFSPGYVARSRLIARGLVKAFPRGEPPSTSCLVR